MIQLLYILILLATYFLTKAISPGMATEELSTLIVGVMLLTSYLFSNLVKKIKFPRLTGYMLMGAIQRFLGYEIILMYVEADRG